MLGSMLAYVEVLRGRSVQGGASQPSTWYDTKVTRDVLSFVGLGLITLSVLLLSSSVAFPGWWALAPTTGAALILAVGPTAWVNRHVLSLRPLIFVGLISYPLYLWHWPILAFLWIQLGGELSHGIRAAAIFASFLLAWITYRFVETPLRFGAHPQAKVLGLAGAMAAIAVCAFFTAHGLKPKTSRDNYVAYFSNRRPDYQYGNTHKLFVLGREECNFLDIVTNTAKDRIADSCTMPQSGTSVLLWGDSHIQHLASGLRATLPPEISLLQVATSGCRPDLEKTSNQTLACARSNEFARQTVVRVRPDIVILAQKDRQLETD